MKKLLLGLIFTATLSTSFAGDKGNGGVGISCPQTMENEALRGYMFFDYYEAITKYKVTVVPPSGNTVYEKVEDLISRIADHDPERAEKYLTWLESFESEAARLGRTTLPESKDMSLARFDSRCKLTQAILQGEPLLPGDARYTINSDFFNKLDLNQQAYGVMHEIIFREAREVGHENSRFVRYFLSQIMGDLVNDMSVYEYTKLLDIYLNQGVDNVNIFSVKKDGVEYLNHQGISWSLDGDVMSYSGEFTIDGFEGEFSGSLKYQKDGSYLISTNNQEFLLKFPNYNVPINISSAVYDSVNKKITIHNSESKSLQVVATIGVFKYMTDARYVEIDLRQNNDLSEFFNLNGFELKRYTNHAIPEFKNSKGQVITWHDAPVEKVVSWHNEFIPSEIIIKDPERERRLGTLNVYLNDDLGNNIYFDVKGDLIARTHLRTALIGLRHTVKTTGLVYFKKVMNENGKGYQFLNDYSIATEDKSLRIKIDGSYKKCLIKKGQKIYLEPYILLHDDNRTCK